MIISRILSFFIIISLSLLSWCSSGSSKYKNSNRSTRPLGNLAVMNFDSSNVQKELRVTVSEIVRAEIASLENIPYRIIEREMLNKVLKEQSLSMTGVIAPGNSSRVGKVLFADYLVLGQIFRSGKKYRISIKIVETETSVLRKQVIEEVRDYDSIPLGAKSASYKLFDREFTYATSDTGRKDFKGGKFKSIYTDSKGIHKGGEIYLEFSGNMVTGYSSEDIGKAEMKGVIDGDFINGHYKAPYGYGNFSFRVSEDKEYLTGTYYQVSNGAHGDWIAKRGDNFSLPDDLFTGKWNIGDKCISKWSGDGYGYPGKIGGIKDGMYFISYDDGDSEWRLEKYLKSENIREGDIVFGNWKSKGKYYRGKITSRTGEQILIYYDDGDKENTTISKVRIMF